MDEQIKKEGELASTLIKVNKTRVDVSMNPKKYLLKHFQDELAKLVLVDTSSFSAEDKKLYDGMKKGYEENIARYSKEKLEAVMVPLRYNDLQVVKNGVLEALKYSQEFNFDDDIKMKAMVREEHTFTVYLSLRKKDDITKKYYESQEAIAEETETTIDELYGIYVENFVLSETERKNS